MTNSTKAIWLIGLLYWIDILVDYWLVTAGINMVKIFLAVLLNSRILMPQMQQYNKDWSWVCKKSWYFYTFYMYVVFSNLDLDVDVTVTEEIDVVSGSLSLSVLRRFSLVQHTLFFDKRDPNKSEILLFRLLNKFLAESSQKVNCELDADLKCILYFFLKSNLLEIHKYSGLCSFMSIVTHFTKARWQIKIAYYCGGFCNLWIY